MMKHLLTLASFALLVHPAPARAGAGPFTIVNGTDAAMQSVAIRRFGTESWQQLTVAPPPGARGVVPFNSDDCAFDLRATLAGGGTAVWSGVNLCEAKVVTLHRDSSGAVWVDYD